MRALIILNGDVDPVLLHAEWEDADFVVGADGGAALVTRAGRACDLIIGDRDSLDAEALASARQLNPDIEVRAHPRLQYATDAEVALEAAMAKTPDNVVLVGGFGGARLDHMLGNIMLLGDHRWRDTDIVLRDPNRDVRLVCTRCSWYGTCGDTVTLLAVGGDAEGVVTEGLRYPLDDGLIPFGSSLGVSNVMNASRAAVQVKHGAILVVHERQSGLPPTMSDNRA